MSSDLSQVNMLTRREIEARIAGPLIKAFADAFGKEKTLEIAERVILSLAKKSGAELARMAGGNSLEHFAKAVERMSEGGAHEQEIVRLDSKHFYINTKRCRYAEMYRELGIAELGYLLSCNRDFAMVEGFNPKIKLKRTQTLMEGGEICDFRFELEESD
jgi:predicted hydrocarbon binding protein